VYVNAIGELAGYGGKGRLLRGTTMTMPNSGGTVGRGASIDASDLDCLAVVLVGAPNVHEDIDHGGRQVVMPLDNDDNDNDDENDVVAGGGGMTRGVIRRRRKCTSRPLLTTLRGQHKQLQMLL
jgi:hypothetical protein